MSDAIAAVATPPGSGGIGVIRVSGDGAVGLAAALVGVDAAALADRVKTRGTARDATGARLDDVLVVAMRAPRSYTGEDVAEIHAHGGAVNLALLLRRLLALGARSAEPGEFTRRAFENGKLDLTRAEAVIDVIEAASERALRVAQGQLAGRVGDEVRALRDRAVAALAEVEASVDFPEEDLGVAEASAAAGQLLALAGDVERLAGTFSTGRALREGVAVAIVGPVNAGKSSLFNALVGSERAIVTPEAGTTRDFVEAQVVWDGVPVTLIDTAGERTGQSEAERRGIELSRARAASADVRLAVCEVTQATDAAPSAAGPGRVVRVVSKADVDPGAVARWRAVEPPVVVTSVEQALGLEELRGRVLAEVAARPSEGDDGALVTSERQRALLEGAGGALREAASGTRERRPPELVAVDLREAADRLAGILGERVGDDVLDALFARFCIGK